MLCTVIKAGLLALLSLLAAGCLAATSKEPLAVEGQWLAARPDASYVALNFADATAVFDNRGDTINRFSYVLDQVKRELVLTDPFGTKQTAPILKLDKDSLVFSRLWDLTTVQRFYKSKR